MTETSAADSTRAIAVKKRQSVAMGAARILWERYDFEIIVTAWVGGHAVAGAGIAIHLGEDALGVVALALGGATTGIVDGLLTVLIGSVITEAIGAVREAIEEAKRGND